MKRPTLLSIEHSQREYLDLLLQHKVYVESNDLSVTKICALLDEVKLFWLKKLKSVEFELEELAASQVCLLLSGAIFLNVSEYEHYFFKSLGDCHIISDPFSKLELIFRRPEEKINVEYTVNYFKQAFFDTLEILTTYKSYFYVLPIQEIAVEEPEKHRELLDLFFWKFISGIFDCDFTSHEEFSKKYTTFEEMEADLSRYALEHLVFGDLNDSNLSLRERVKKHGGEFSNISLAIGKGSETQMFLIAVYSYIAQIADILYVCSVLKLNPYIRFDITFTYLTLVMSIFIDDDNLRMMIERSLVCHLFYQVTNKSVFENIAFSDYCKQLEGKDLLNSIIAKIRAEGIDIFKGNISQVVNIIKEEFRLVLAN